MILHKYHSAAAAVLAASALVACPEALATVVCNTTTVPIAIPAADNIGIYLNFVTGATGTVTPPAGWDFNPYESTTVNALRFWWNSDAASHAGLLDGAGTSFAVLAAGAPINATGTFSAASGSTQDALMGPWRAGVSGGYLGISFTNEATAATNFGWVQMTTTAGNGFPATINAFCFQNDGSGITAGTTPVSLQTFSVD